MNSKNSNVYVTQEVRRFNNETQEREPIYDLSPALAFGDIKIVLDHSVGFSAQPVIHEIRRKLKDFSDNDYLLLLGDPTAILLCGVVAAENNNGRVRMLRFDRRQHKYVEMSVDLRQQNVGAMV